MDTKDMDVQEYKFMSFTSMDSDASVAKRYEFKEIDRIAKIKQKVVSKEQLHFERTKAKEQDFEISPIVKQHRKHKREEEEEFENRVQSEVERRFEKTRSEAFEIGHQEGKEEGLKEIFHQQKVNVEEKLEILQGLLEDVLRRKDDIYKNQDKEIFTLVKNLTKWVIIRELRDDNKYLERLFEKMLLELQAKSNLLVKVSSKDFSRMPEVLEAVQANLGKLQNVRIEIDKSIETTGLIVESENGIINGSLEEQLRGIDRLFESVGVYES